MSEVAAPQLLDAAEIRARKRPRALLLVWAWELVCAALVATPVHAWGTHVWGRHPDGDAGIFAPDGHALLTWLGETGSSLPIVVNTSLVAIVVVAILGQLVTGALVASLATSPGPDRREPSLSFVLRSGAAAFVPLLAIGVLAGACEGFVLGLGLLAAGGVNHAMEGSGDARAFTVHLVVLSVFVVVMLAVGVALDFARVTIARDAAVGDPTRRLGERLRVALVAAAQTARRSLGRATFAWGWRAALGLVLIYAGSRAGDLTGGRGGLALWGLFAVHQLIVLARVALRASWLAKALRFVAA